MGFIANKKEKFRILKKTYEGITGSKKPVGFTRTMIPEYIEKLQEYV